MKFMIDPLKDILEFKELLGRINKNENVTLTGPSESQKAHISHAVLEFLNKKGIFISYDEMQAVKMYEDFRFYYGDEAVFLPSKEIMLFNVESKSNEEIFERIKTMDRISRGDYKVVVTSAEAFIHKLVEPEKFKKNIISFSTGEKVNLFDLTKKFIAAGYEKIEIVDGPGQFSIRGGIIDVFSVNYENALRIDLFDDEIESIKTFDVLTQRSLERLENIHIIPVVETIYGEKEREQIISDMRMYLENYLSELRTNESTKNAKTITEKVEEDIEKLKNKYYYAGIDRLIPMIVNKPCFITEYDKNALVFVDEPLKFKQKIDSVLSEHREICADMLDKAMILPESIKCLFDENEVENNIKKSQLIAMSSIGNITEMFEEETPIVISVKSINSYRGHIDLLAEELIDYKKKKYKTIILAGSKGRGERLADALRLQEIETVYSEKPEIEIMPGQIIITNGSLNNGFVYPSAKLVVISEREFFGSDKKQNKYRKKTKENKINLFADLKIGDYVVHRAHGIGQYIGIEQIVVENTKRDYIKIKYRDDANLYIPINQLDLIQKYIGSEGKTPKISKLGGCEWDKTKKRVKESLRELAEELVRLYAERQSIKGIGFSKDSVWQRQFEELFTYDETEDQLKCIEEIKTDMETPKPMDRLLCGDVGYGKTEVALRAAFKAVMDGKQVAYLVPTTVLAQQHYQTFNDRMRDFPVTVDVLSRFRNQSEQKKILKNLKSGNIDILIGTHRLLQKDIFFKDIGLLIVDEEQRFGVTHKEKIKNLMPNIDVLTLTATPIPRTLHMSLSGIRDISIIEDPPDERYPIQTYVTEYNPDIIQNAISHELKRNGQVFYLSNRVMSINKKAYDIQKMMPDAKIAVAHGQLSEKELDDIMFRFVNKEYDILICTTIIESGLDMPNVNTIIVEDADKMGLAQLYQLRGRVGRSNRLAYAYITYKKGKILSEIAEKRLRAIKEFTEFGSGFKIAMRDLELRGAGNLLGAEQHGHLESVGYDMYCRLLDEAVKEKRGEKSHEDKTETTVDINVNAYISKEYISSEEQKIEMYKKIASIFDEKDAEDICDELEDRFGNIPQNVNNLILVSLIKAVADRCGFESVTEKNRTIVFTYRKGIKPELEMLSKVMEKFKGKLLFSANEPPSITFRNTNIDKIKMLEEIKTLFCEIEKLNINTI